MIKKRVHNRKSTLIVFTILTLFIAITYLIFIGKVFQPYPDASITSSAQTFKATDQLVFRVNLAKKTITKNLLFKKAYANSDPTIKAEFIKNGSRINIEGVDIKKEHSYQYVITAPIQSTFSPGEYKLKVDIIKDNEVTTLTKDFSWGVIAVNTNKTLYKPGEKAYIQMGVLDESGKTLCNANLKLTIISPKGHTQNFSTDKSTITKSNQCKGDSYTTIPDYWIDYNIPNEIGKYKMEITAVTKNGEKSISESFEVVENIAYDIERIGPTRIYPPVPYNYQIVVRAKENFNGSITEIVPKEFEITNTSKPNIKFTTKTLGNIKNLVWDVDLKKDQKIELSYSIKFPNISPEFYLLGPLKFTSGRTLQFEEKRQWQIASDAVITFVANRGSANTKTSGTTLSITPSSNIVAGRVAIVRAVSDNIQTTNGTSSDHTVNDDQSNTWTKVREQTFGGGSAGSGVTVSLWASQITTTITTSDNITLTTSSSVDAKTISVEEFSLPANYTLEVIGNAGDQGTGTSPSSTLSGLSSKEYLWIGALGIEGPSTDSFTQDTDYTTLTADGTTGGNIDTNVTLRGGYRTYTGTSDTYNTTIDNRGVIEYIGSSTGTTSSTLPTHQADDLLLAFAYRDGSTTAPSLPTGWTNIGTAGGANTNSSRLGYQIAPGSGTSSGTWTNATSVVFHVYRGVDTSTPIGADGNTGSSGTTVTYPAISLNVTDGSSWVVGFAGHRSTNTSLETPPSGMTNRANVSDTTDEASGHDTNGGTTSWSNTNVSVGGTSSGWRARTVEIRAAPINRDWAAITGALRGVPPKIDVSGRIYTDEGINSLNCSTPRVIRLRVNGTDYTDTVNCSNSPSNGSYSFTGVEIPSNNDVIIVYLDGETENATTITRVPDASSNVTGLDLYQNKVIVRHEDSGPITNTNLDVWDSGDEGDGIDGDTGFTVTTGNLTISNTRELIIWNSKTFTPGGDVNTNSGGEIQVNPLATFTITGENVNSGGNFTTVGSGTISCSGSTGTVTMTAGGTLGGGSGDITFCNLSTSSTGTTNFSGSGTNTVNNNITVGAGTTLNLNSNISIGGSLNNTTSGVIGYSGTPTVTMTGSGSIGGGTTGSITFYNLNTSGTGTVSFANGGTNTIDNNISVGSGTTLNINSDITVNGNITNTTTGIIGTSTGTPTVTVNGNTIGGGSGTITFHNLTTANAGTTTFSGSGTNTINNNLSITNGTFSQSSPLTVTGDISVGSGATYSAGDTLTINGGAFTTTSTGSITYSGTPTVTISGTGNIGGGSGSIDFYNLTCNGSQTAASSINVNRTLTIGGSASLNMQSNDLVVGLSGIANSGSIANSGTLSQSSSGTTTILSSSGGTASIGGSGSTTFYNLSIAPTVASAPTITLGNGASQTINVTNNFTIGNGSNNVNVTAASNDPTIDVNNDFIISSTGNFTSTSDELRIAGDMTNNGTFSNDNGTVVFDGAGVSVISGTGNPAITFHNLTATTASKELNFTAGQTFRVNGLLSFDGQVIDSTTTSQWFINHQGTESVTNTTITNSGCDVLSTLISVDITDTNGGNNGACWDFASVVYPNPVRVGGSVVIKGNTRIKN